MLTPTWHQGITAYLVYLRAGGAPATTIALRREHLLLIAQDVGGSPWQLHGDRLVEAFSAMRCAQETRRSRRTTMRAFYRWALEAGRTRSNPALALPVVKASRPNPRPVSDVDYARALAAAGTRERLMLRLAAEVGMRRAEVAAAHSDDLVPDLQGWSLRVVGKGSRERVLPLPFSLAAELLQAPRGYFFPGDCDGHLSPRYVGTLVGRLLPEGWTMHKLRHRFATRAYAVDRDVFVVQDLLGHASPATTRCYVAIPNDSLRRTVEAAA